MKITTDKIISIIAHDLKDPLSAIAGISDILIHNWVDFSDDEKMDILNEIRDTSDATYKMLNDLL
ncbi:MAG TPA: histidine kinase dimerization/phospho-acceptor domain-containing protein, partial [Prolixibacteraceae bacterium]|nr:histidine kinase dimerization/phospho-acceptor domain-containing protein [Prolixibacteraceae bacterium]